jgi:tripartite-type tricarboxylate transporter receptor subunit TctC
MIRKLGALLALSMLALQPAAAQSDFPTKPIHMIVPYAPGGLFDIHARLLAGKMKDILGQPVVVENKPGGATTVGATFVAQSKPDGYTLLLCGANAMSYAQHQFKDLKYTNADFQPITMVNLLNQAWTINTNVVPAKSVAEFVSFVKARPGKFSYGTSGGTGSIQHMFGEQFKAVFGLDLTQVGYRGTNDLVQELSSSSGQLALAIDSYGPYSSQMQPKGPLLSIAINSKNRMEIAPIPTFEELGYPEMTAITWGGVLAPAGTPAPVIEKLYKAIVEANNSPEIRAMIIASGANPTSTSPAEFRKLIDEETAKWKTMIEKLNFKPQG